MKIKFDKVSLRLNAVLITSVLASMAAPSTFSWADDVKPAPPAPADAIAVKCNIDNYRDRVDQIMHFGPKQNVASYGAGSAGTGIMIFGAYTGAAPIALAGVVVMSVGGADYLAIKEYKKIKAKHPREVLDALAEDKGQEPGDKHLRDQTGKIGDMLADTNYTVADVKAAIIAANDAGDLCDESGKLLVTDKFRKKIAKYLPTPSLKIEVKTAEIEKITQNFLTTMTPDSGADSSAQRSPAVDKQVTDSTVVLDNLPLTTARVIPAF